MSHIILQILALSVLTAMPLMVVQLIKSKQPSLMNATYTMCAVLLTATMPVIWSAGGGASQASRAVGILMLMVFAGITLYNIAAADLPPTHKPTEE